MLSIGFSCSDRKRTAKICFQMKQPYVINFYANDSINLRHDRIRLIVIMFLFPVFR